MAKKSHDEDEDLDIVEEEETTTPGRGPQPPRMSLTLPESVRRKVRLAAAILDMTEPEWARVVLTRAAKLTKEKAGLE